MSHPAALLKNLPPLPRGFGSRQPDALSERTRGRLRRALNELSRFRPCPPLVTVSNESVTDCLAFLDTFRSKRL